MRTARRAGASTTITEKATGQRFACERGARPRVRAVATAGYGVRVDAERPGEVRAAHAGVVDRRPRIEGDRARERANDDRLEPRVADETRGGVERRGVVARERDADAVSGAMRLRPQGLEIDRVEGPHQPGAGQESSRRGRRRLRRRRSLASRNRRRARDRDWRNRAPPCPRRATQSPAPATARRRRGPNRRRSRRTARPPPANPPTRSAPPRRAAAPGIPDGAFRSGPNGPPLPRARRPYPRSCPRRSRRCS